MLFIADAVWNKMVNVFLHFGKYLVSSKRSHDNKCSMGTSWCCHSGFWNLSHSHAPIYTWQLEWVEMGWCPGDRLELWEVQYSDPYVPKYYLEPLLVYNYLKWILLLPFIIKFWIVQLLPKKYLQNPETDLQVAIVSDSLDCCVKVLISAIHGNWFSGS